MRRLCQKELVFSLRAEGNVRGNAGRKRSVDRAACQRHDVLARSRAGGPPMNLSLSKQEQGKPCHTRDLRVRLPLLREILLFAKEHMCQTAG